MDAEERPSKIRKLSHDEDAADARETSTPSHNPAPSDLPLDQVIANKPSVSVVAEQCEAIEYNDQNSGRLTQPPTDLSPPQPLSKNQQKKLRKKQEWEAGREWRKAKRKAKDKEKRERKRELRTQEVSEHRQQQQQQQQQPVNGAAARNRPPPVPKQQPVRLPITFVIDCDFDDMMLEKERISLGSQLTRAYSDNSRAPYQAHLIVSSWGGILRQRFETVLRSDHLNWKKEGIAFTEDDFVAAAQQAGEVMRGPDGGEMAGQFLHHHSDNSVLENEEKEEKEAEVVYLTSDSPHTLTHLRPYSTYVIGGIVDKNRHKGLCYRRAVARGVATAKLPITEFMEMQSRNVLATNHVVEIMVRWLACGDWGQAFVQVIPARKGGRLKAAPEAEAVLKEGEEVEDRDKEAGEAVAAEEEDGRNDDEDDDNDDDDDDGHENENEVHDRRSRSRSRSRSDDDGGSDGNV